MKGTMAVQYCDSEDGCTEWMVDHHAMDVSNWRELLGGWTFDPKEDHALCPYHHPDAVATRKAELDALMGDGSEHLYPTPEENFWDDRTMTGEGA